MKSKTQKRVFKEVSLAKWIPHANDNIEDPGETIIDLEKLKGKKLGEVEKKHLRLFKKNYRMGGKGSPRKTEEGKRLWPLLHYYEHFKAQKAGAEGDHEIPSVEELNERRETGVVAGSESEIEESSDEDEEDEEDDAAESEDEEGGVVVPAEAEEEEEEPAQKPSKSANSRKRKSTAEPNEYAFMATYDSKKKRMEKAKLAAPEPVPVVREKREKREKRVKREKKGSKA